VDSFRHRGRLPWTPFGPGGPPSQRSSRLPPSSAGSPRTPPPRSEATCFSPSERSKRWGEYGEAGRGRRNGVTVGDRGTGETSMVDATAATCQGEGRRRHKQPIQERTDGASLLRGYSTSSRRVECVRRSLFSPYVKSARACPPGRVTWGFAGGQGQNRTADPRFFRPGIPQVHSHVCAQRCLLVQSDRDSHAQVQEGSKEEHRPQRHLLASGLEGPGWAVADEGRLSTKAAAERFLENVTADLITGSHTDPRRPLTTFERLAEQWSVPFGDIDNPGLPLCHLHAPQPEKGESQYRSVEIRLRYRLDLPKGALMSVSVWEIECIEEFEEWWRGLAEEQQEALDERAMLFAEHGPILKRPAVGEVTPFRHPRMKELRVSEGGALQVLFVFSPRRHASFLWAGTGQGDGRSGTSGRSRSRKTSTTPISESCEMKGYLTRTRPTEQENC